MRYTYILDRLVQHHMHALFVGPTGLCTLHVCTFVYSLHCLYGASSGPDLLGWSAGVQKWVEPACALSVYAADHPLRSKPP